MTNTIANTCARNSQQKTTRQCCRAGMWQLCANLQKLHMHLPCQHARQQAKSTYTGRMHPPPGIKRRFHTNCNRTY